MILFLLWIIDPWLSCPHRGLTSCLPNVAEHLVCNLGSLGKAKKNLSYRILMRIKGEMHFQSYSMAHRDLQLIILIAIIYGNTEVSYLAWNSTLVLPYAGKQLQLIVLLHPPHQSKLTSSFAWTSASASWPLSSYSHLLFLPPFSKQKPKLSC